MDPSPIGNATVVAIVTLSLLMLVAGPGRAPDRLTYLVMGGTLALVARATETSAALVTILAAASPLVLAFFQEAAAWPPARPALRQIAAPARFAFGVFALGFIALVATFFAVALRGLQPDPSAMSRALFVDLALAHAAMTCTVIVDAAKPADTAARHSRRRTGQ